MQTTNGDLIGAHTALVRMGEADLPSGTVGFRFALNRNHMKWLLAVLVLAACAVPTEPGPRMEVCLLPDTVVTTQHIFVFPNCF